MHLVLVHGGTFTAQCWSTTIVHLETPALAVDLPGRGAHPADLATVTIGDWVDSVVGDIEAAGLDDVVLVGHSLAGVTIPGVAARLPERVRRLVFVSCTVPVEGGNVLGEVAGDMGEVAHDNLDNRETGGGMSPEMVRSYFCNDMDDAQFADTLAQMVPEAMGPIVEPVSRTGVPPVPRTWVRLLQDLTVTPPMQDHMIDNLGGVDEVIELDSAHMAMLSRPRDLARILDDIASRV